MPDANSIIVLCVSCHKRTEHRHIHMVYYEENTHIPGSECWVCSQCSWVIDKEDNLAYKLGLPFVHD